MCNGLSFRLACESPESDQARRTPGEIKKRGFYLIKEKNNNGLFKLKKAYLHVLSETINLAIYIGKTVAFVRSGKISCVLFRSFTRD